MGSCIKNVIEALIRKLQSDVLENTVLVPPNEYYEIKQTPSLLVIGPKLEENREKRISEKRVEVDRDNLSYTERNWPRYYHLDFDFVLTTDTGPELLDLQEKVIPFFLDNIAVAVPIVAGWGLGPFGIEPWGSDDGALKFYLRGDDPHRRTGASEPIKSPGGVGAIPHRGR